MLFQLKKKRKKKKKCFYSKLYKVYGKKKEIDWNVPQYLVNTYWLKMKSHTNNFYLNRMNSFLSNLILNVNVLFEMLSKNNNFAIIKNIKLCAYLKM